MAATLIEKRLRLARTAVISATAIYDAESALKSAAAEAAESGNFVDAELWAQSDLSHLTANLVGRVLQNMVTDFEAWLNGNESNNPGNPTRRSLLLQMRK